MVVVATAAAGGKYSLGVPFGRCDLEEIDRRFQGRERCHRPFASLLFVGDMQSSSELMYTSQVGEAAHGMLQAPRAGI